MTNEHRIVRTEHLDDLDRAILRELMRDGRMTNVEVAERVHLSPSACLRRVRALEERGVIESYVALLDAVRAGLTGAAFVFVTLEQQGRAMLDAFERDARRHPEITECIFWPERPITSYGSSSAILRDLERIHTEILTQLPGVSRVQSTLSLRTVKKTTVLPIYSHPLLDGPRLLRTAGRQSDGEGLENGGTMATFGQTPRTLWIAAAAAAAAIGAASAGTLDKVRQDQTIRLGVREDAPPFSFKDANGAPAGFMVDLCRAVATGLAAELDLGN